MNFERAAVSFYSVLHENFSISYVDKIIRM